MQNKEFEEKTIPFLMSGWITLGIALLALGLSINYCYQYVHGLSHGEDVSVLIILKYIAFGLVLPGILLVGNTTLNINEGKVYTFQGNYKGTLRKPGYWWVPFWWGVYSERDLSDKTLETKVLEITDADGNPIHIACQVFYREDNTAQASFAVSDTGSYLISATEKGLRHIASKHPLDTDHDDAQPTQAATEESGNNNTTKPTSLRGSMDETANELIQAMQEKFTNAGCIITDVAFSRLNYAPEIAQAMLQVQAAYQTGRARKKITESAVNIADETVKALQQKGVSFSDDQKANFVTALTVTLVSHQPVTPTVHVGGTMSGVNTPNSKVDDEE